MSTNISYSALKVWNDCPYKYKLTYIDKVEGFKGNEHTAFGTALHEACEKKLLDNSLDELEIFKTKFEEELNSIFANSEYNKTLITEMNEQGLALAPLILPALKEQFGNFTILNTEEELLLTLKEIAATDRNFKGYIDLVLKTDDDKIHIIDWKTCSWGWDIEKKSDAVTSYQLTYYKHFYGLKHNIDPKKIETYFGLLKRTAKKDRVELFRVTSGPKKVQNALNLLNKFVHNVEKDFFPKNRMNCEYCDFKKIKACT
jgi:ATP-dependent exoDNAse (exonuclease V) beta subunit